MFFQIHEAKPCLLANRTGRAVAKCRVLLRPGSAFHRLIDTTRSLVPADPVLGSIFHGSAVQALVNRRGRGYINAMSRTPIAIIAGLAGFALYVAAAMIISDYVFAWHWTVQVIYFVIAGTLWVLPMRWLMFWGAGMR
jgi:hypothetical protein